MSFGGVLSMVVEVYRNVGLNVGLYVSELCASIDPKILVSVCAEWMANMKMK